VSAVRYFRVPAERATENGIFVGGAWIGFAKASPTGETVATVPAAGDYSWAMPGWPECQADGTDLPEEHIPSSEEVDAAAQAAAGAPDGSGAENGASGQAGGASEIDPK
jgi:hypothetical protein